jgi:hypothetical protein
MRLGVVNSLLAGAVMKIVVKGENHFGTLFRDDSV